MHDQVARVLYHVQIHLLYASVVGLAAAALTATRAGSAGAKYWIWVVASLNFVVPVPALLDASLASHFGWASPLGTPGEIADRLARRTTGIARSPRCGRAARRLCSRASFSGSASSFGPRGPRRRRRP